MKWLTLIKTLKPNIGYNWNTLLELTKQQDIFSNDADVYMFLDNAVKSGMLWRGQKQFYHSKKADLHTSPEYQLNLFHPRVQVCLSVE